MTGQKRLTILFADDDEDDVLIAKDALADSGIVNDFRVVHNGGELIEYLKRCGQTEDTPMPGLVLLDLKMPVMDGVEALKIIRSRMQTRWIPVVVLTSSNSETDIKQAYNLGVNSFVTKPDTYEDFTAAIKAIISYWSLIAELPYHAAKN